VQASRWSRFLGLPVALWGVGYYASVLLLALAALQERFMYSRGVSLALAVITGWGLIFSAWLTSLEAFTIKAWCQWCIVSAVLATLLFLIAFWDWRNGPPLPEPEDAAGEPATTPSSMLREQDGTTSPS
jgi:uncharacterized membrane protein